MRAVSGTSGAAPVWRDVMLALHAGRPGAAAAAPAGDRAAPASLRRRASSRRAANISCAGTGADADRRRARRARAARASSIRSAGSVYALDPDIPLDRQRLAVAVTGRGASAHRLVLDRRDLGAADAPPLILRRPRPHRLRLVDLGGRVGRPGALHDALSGDRNSGGEPSRRRAFRRLVPTPFRDRCRPSRHRPRRRVIRGAAERRSVRTVVRVVAPAAARRVRRCPARRPCRYCRTDPRRSCACGPASASSCRRDRSRRPARAPRADRRSRRCPCASKLIVQRESASSALRRLEAEVAACRARHNTSRRR